MTKLGDYVEIKTGKLDANAAAIDGAYPFFTCARNTLQIDKYAFDADAILVAGNGDLNVKHYQGKFNAYQRTYVITVKLSEVLNVRYLYHWMSKYVDRLRELSIGGVIKYIKLGMLTDAEFPLPPLDEQKQIAAILDKADALRRKREKAIALTDDLLRSVFLDMFGDPVINPKGWDSVALSSICTKITDGTHKTPKYVDEGIKFLSAKNIRVDGLNWSDTKFITRQEHLDLTRRCNPAFEDIVLSKSGSIGTAALVDRDIEFSLFESAALIKYERGKVLPLYLLYYLNHGSSKYFYQRNTKGNSIKHLHLIDLRKLPVRLPPVEMQLSFDSAANVIINSKNHLRSALAHERDLSSALSILAFRGELFSKDEAA